MPDQKTRFGLTLPNRGVIIGATTVDEMFTLAQKAEEADWDSVWVALGSPQQCIDRLQAFIDAGATTITLRLTGYDQKQQFERVTNEVVARLR